jgi:DNA polymerase III subunit delta'
MDAEDHANNTADEWHMSGEERSMRATIGHEQAWRRLVSAYARGQVHHAYLLTGPEGIGKTTLALDFAGLLLCERPGTPPDQGDQAPCGDCSACRRILHGNHPDVALVEVEEGKRLLGVEAVRETVVRLANLAPSTGAWRIFIVPAVERMTPNTVNALLKTLEEPPPGVVLMLATAEPEALLPTLLSRCQLLALQPLTAGEVALALTSRWHAAPEEARTLAALADGRLGWAVRAHERPELRDERAELLRQLTRLTAASRDERLREAAALAPDAARARSALRLWIAWWRDVTLAACGAAQLVSEGETQQEAVRQGQAIGAVRAEAFLRTLVEAEVALDANANPRLTFDVLLLELPYLHAKPRAQHS